MDSLLILIYNLEETYPSTISNKPFLILYIRENKIEILSITVEDVNRKFKVNKNWIDF